MEATDGTELNLMAACVRKLSENTAHNCTTYRIKYEFVKIKSEDPKVKVPLRLRAEKCLGSNWTSPMDRRSTVLQVTPSLSTILIAQEVTDSVYN
jgi:hypothetical protein